MTLHPGQSSARILVKTILAIQALICLNQLKQKENSLMSSKINQSKQKIFFFILTSGDNLSI